MEELNVNNSREFTNLVHNLRDPNNNIAEHSQAHLVSALNLALAEGWVNMKSSLHVHLRVRLVGEPIADELCFLFQRERRNPKATDMLKQDGVRVPANSLTDSVRIGERDRRIQASMLIQVGKIPKSSKHWYSAGVRLRILDDCPRVPINIYPIKCPELWLVLFKLDFIKESFWAFTNRKLVPPSWFMSVSKDELPDEMVKGTADIVDNISCNNRESDIGLRERLNHYNVPGAITPYIAKTKIGLLFAPKVPLRYESAVVLFGPPELGSNSGEVSYLCSHMLYYPHDL